MAADTSYLDEPTVEDQTDLDREVAQEIAAQEIEKSAEQPAEQPAAEEQPKEEEAPPEEQPPEPAPAPRAVAVAPAPRQVWHADPVVDSSGNIVTPGQAPSKPAQAQVGNITPLTDADAQEPGIDIASNGYTKGRGDQSVRNVILHSTDGSEQSDVNTLTQSGKVGVHYYTTRDGRVMHFVNDADSAWHAGLTKYGDSGNPYTIGIEQEHVDGQQDWPDAQVQATARTAAAILKRNPQLSVNDIIGHSDIAPERKVDPVGYPWDKFRGYVNAYLGQLGAQLGAQPGTLPAQTVAQQGPVDPWQLDPVVDAQGNVTMPGAAPAPKAVSVEPGKVVVQAKPGFYQDEDPNTWVTGTATKFGYNDPNDPGVGSTWVGKLNTNNTYLYGVAIPQYVLEAQFGHNYAAMRRARVDVVNPQTGDRIRVPIVDVGPGADALNNGVITDFTEATNRTLGNTGSTQYKLNIVPNAGPDVLKNPQNFWDEQAALAHGIDTAGIHKSVVAQGGGSYWQTDPLVPAPLVAAADQARTYQNQSQIGVLSALAQNNPSLTDLYNKLSQPIPGTKDPDTGQVVGMVSDPIRQQFQQNLKNEITQQAQSQYGIADPNAAFAKAMTEPGFGDYAAEFGKKVVGNLQQAFSVLGVPDVDRQRLNQAVGEMIPDAPQDQKDALAQRLIQASPAERSQLLAQYPLPYTTTVDPADLIPSIERLADPQLQAAKAADQAALKTSMAANMATDLRLQGKTATWILDNLAQVPSGLVTGAVPPWMFAQIYQQSLAEQQAQHPELDSGAQEANAAKSAMINTFGQELGNRLLLGGGGFLLNGLKASWQRALGQVAVNTAGQAALMGGSQALTNLATGEPVTQGVLQATGAGAIVGGTFGTLHAAGELAHPALGETKTAERAQATTGPSGARVRGPEAATLETGAAEAAAPPEAVPAQPPAQPPAAPEAEPVQPMAEVAPTQGVAPAVPEEVPVQPAAPVELATVESPPVSEQALGGGVREPAPEQERLQNLVRAHPELFGDPNILGSKAQILVRNLSDPWISEFDREEIERAFNNPDQYARDYANLSQKRVELANYWVNHPDELVSALQEYQDLPRRKEGESPEEYSERIMLRLGGEAEANIQRVPLRTWAKKLAMTLDPGAIVDLHDELVGRGAAEVTPPKRALLTAPPEAEAAAVPEEVPVRPPAEPVTPPPVPPREQPPAVPPNTGDEPWVSTIANRYTQERAAHGEIGEVAPGQGYATQELVNRGLRMKPEEVTQHISDVMNNRGGDPVRQAAAIRAEEARLSQRSAQAARISEANPSDMQARLDAQNAFQNLTDFHNGPVAKLKNNWHAQGMAMQGELPIDLSTYNGIREKWLRDTGKVPPPNLEPAMRNTAARIRNGEAAEAAALNKLGTAIAQTKGKIPPADVIARNIMERLKVDPCIIP